MFLKIGVLEKLRCILNVSFIYSTDIFAHYFSPGKTACSIFTLKILQLMSVSFTLHVPFLTFVLAYQLLLRKLLFSLRISLLKLLLTACCSSKFTC